MAVSCAFARMFLIVESFRLLFFADKNASVATWASNIPNLSWHGLLTIEKAIHVCMLRPLRSTSAGARRLLRDLAGTIVVS